MWNISLQGVTHLGVIIVVDVLFHFMYILTIPTDLRLLKHLSDWALGQCHLQDTPHLKVSWHDKQQRRLNRFGTRSIFC